MCRRGWLRQVIGWTLAAILITACQASSPANTPWVPPYLQLRLCDGGGQWQWLDGSEWQTLALDTELAVGGGGWIAADSVEGARICFAEGSEMELAPDSIVEIHNPLTLPRLQVVLPAGALSFQAQSPSFEFLLADYALTILNVPMTVRLTVDEEMVHIAVDGGSLVGVRGSESFTLFTCQEATLRSEQPAILAEFCVTQEPSPSPVPSLLPGIVPSTATATATSSPTATIVPTRRPVTATPAPTATPTSAPPPDEPPPPPPPPVPTDTPEPPPPTAEPPSPTPEPPPTEVPTEEPRPTPTASGSIG